MDKIKRDELAIEECCRRYIRLCPETVLADCKGYAKEIKALKTELNSILELKAVSNSEVHTLTISDPTGETAVKRVDLAMQIAVLEQMDNIVKKSLNRLDDTQRDIINLFFFKRGMMGYNVQDFATKNGYSIAGVYRERRLALNAFAEIMNEYLGLDNNPL